MADKQSILKQFQTALRGGGDRIDVAHVSEIAESMMKRFGSVDGFTEFWFKQIQKESDRCDENGSNRKTVLDNLWRVFEAHKSSTEHRDSAPDMSTLTDADIESLLIDGAKAMLLTNPDLARQILAVQDAIPTQARLIEMQQDPAGDSNDEDNSDPDNSGPPEEHAGMGAGIGAGMSAGGAA